MLNILATQLDSIILFVSGGGLATFFTLKATKKQAEANAMRAVQEVYQETIKDLREDKEDMRTDNEELKNNILLLEEKVRKISIDIASLKRYKCTVKDCQLRKIE